MTIMDLIFGSITISSTAHSSLVGVSGASFLFCFFILHASHFNEASFAVYNIAFKEHSANTNESLTRSSCTCLTNENQMRRERERESTRATSSHKLSISSNNPHTLLYLCPNRWDEKPRLTRAAKLLSDWSSHTKTWEVQKKCKAETHRCVLELLLSYIRRSFLGKHSLFSLSPASLLVF